MLPVEKGILNFPSVIITSFLYGFGRVLSLNLSLPDNVPVAGELSGKVFFTEEPGLLFENAINEQENKMITKNSFK